MNMNGFIVGRDLYDTNCDLPICFGTQVYSWTSTLFAIISQDNAVPLGEASAFVKGCDENVCSFFFYDNTKFHINLMDFSACIISKHPYQDGQSFGGYLNLVLFHYVMIAFKWDYKEVVANIMTQDAFISNMDYIDLLYSKFNQERCSSDQTLADKYKNGNF